MIDATIANFESEVVEASHQIPILVDLWAPWCGPCRSLGPILEKLEGDYAGRFKLVKINTEDEQELAAAFGVRSIPMVMLMKDGQPVDGFVGALPEGQIRQFLDKHVPAEGEAAEEPSEEAAEPGAALSPLEKLQQALATNPANDEARAAYTELLLREGRPADARMAFEPLAGKIATSMRLAALADWLRVAEAVPGLPDADALRASIAANKRDFDARYAVAQRAFAAQQWTDALDELLEILMRDKNWNDDQARKTYVHILELMMPPVPPKPAADGQPPATDPTVESYRRRLSMVVLS